ncbi:MAG: RNA-binding transcriptional accessory protein [Bacilli bacterium]|nr:RNA-binding transcriptional accessory protein [Bacilli bacterium]
MNIIKELANRLNVKEKQIEAVLKLLSEDCTIPFIARYRKEATGALDEEQISIIDEQYKYLCNLEKRKEDVIRLIKEKDLLTDELEKSILACEKLIEVEDLYRPFKEKKKTKATEAIKMGLEPLAKKIMSFPINGDLNSLASGYNMEIEVAITNASYIISEWISDNAYYRKWTRNFIFNTGFITSKKKKSAEDEKKVFEMYYEFQDRIKYLKHYRTLALNRGEKEGILSVSLDYDNDKIFENYVEKVIKNKNSFVVETVELAIKDALKRLILPSIEREIRTMLTDKASEEAIITFKDNLEKLLMTKPIKNKTVIGFDPAFRTGCKLAVLNPFGEVLEIATIYPHEPHNKKEEATKILRDLITKYQVDIIAIGNGTASRESEFFVSNAIEGLNVKYNIVSEAGASVYSASKLAISEFPDLTVEKRSAISIGRRIQDPLSELVKIDPKSIGVGEYQHDVNQSNLSDALDFTVSKIVNEVGVNINTASSSILKYISGLNKKCIDNLLKFKKEHNFKNREEIKKIAGISDKIYEQCIGFLRINDGDNPLDKTKIHPESYELTEKILKSLNLDINNKNEDFIKTIEKASKEELSRELNSDPYTIEDILKELITPGLDPRDFLEDVLLKSNVLTIDDLTIGMELTGTVRNVVSFGAFVDIGLHNDGLIHISKLSKEFVKNPLDVIHVGDIITCHVESIDKEKEKVNLSLI